MKNKDNDVRKQLVASLKDAENVLVTVSADPSVDELAAALGLSLMLDKMDKHATAVFSGRIPRAIDFLDPEKTFEDTTDSLQDFIIALDKEKADHLRYKVDGDLVKIFITPYRTVIGEKDLEFSQGDYNVDAVVVIGAESIDDLDRALSDHGRIMHDAKVASISVGDLNSQLGTVNLSEPGASSYSEVIASLAEDLRDNKSLLDEQTATALLTGIVAATARFSNEHTTSDAMTLAAQLMAAGANQQLIATHLEEAAGESKDSTAESSATSSESKEDNATESTKDRQAPDGSISISHDKDKLSDSIDDAAKDVVDQREQAAADEAEASLADIATDQSGTAAASSSDGEVQPVETDQPSGETAAEDELSQHLETIQPLGGLPPLSLDSEPEVEPSQSQTEAVEPSFGGTLNATTEEAAEDTRTSEDEDRNHTLLTHNTGGYVNEADSPQPAVNSFNQPETDNEPQVTDIFGGSAPTSQAAPVQPLEPLGQDLAALTPSTLPLAQTAEPYVEPTPGMTLEDIDAANRVPADQPDAARDAVSAAFNVPPAPESTANTPYAAGNVPPVTPDGLPPLPPLPPMPPMPDFSTLPPLPPMPDTPTPPDQPAPGNPEGPTDPGQFQIPNQG